MPASRSFSALTAAQLALLNGAEQVTNKNQASGYAGLDSNSTINAKVIVRNGTRAAIAALVLEAGELAVCTDTGDLRYGDGATAGGLSLTSNANNTVFCPANEASATANGQALQDAYNLAKALTPFGSALSATNRATVELGSGIFDITALAGNLAIDTSYVDLVGRGSNFTQIVTGTNKLSVTAVDHKLVGLWLRSADTSYMMSLTLNNSTLWHEDLFFDTAGDTTKPCIVITNAAGGVAGTIKRVRTVGQYLYGGVSGMTCSALFEDCQAGNISFGGYISLGAGTHGIAAGGILRRCTYTGTNWYAKHQGLMEDCRWNAGVPRCGTNAKFYRNIFITSGTAIDHNLPVNVISCLNIFNQASPYGANVTNLIATPNDVADTDIA